MMKAENLSQNGVSQPLPGGPDNPGAPLTRQPRAIFLDLDDTLWPLEPAMRAAEAHLADWLARQAPGAAVRLDPPGRARLRTEVFADHPERGHDLSFLREELIRRALVAAGEDAALAPIAFRVFIDARQAVTPYADAEEVLGRWSARYRLVALSNGNGDISKTRLARYFSGAVNPSHAGAAKPDPRIFHHACELIGVKPEAALHIGDDPHLDLIAARKAGLQGAWLLREDHAHRHPADACGAWHPAPFRDLAAIEAALAAIG
jgi:putative hydrolase of the HAD superfamily